MSYSEFLANGWWTLVTVAAYWLALSLRRRVRNHPFANPALVAILLLAAILKLTHTAYSDYFHATRLLTWLLGPATVALGLPLARNWGHLQARWRGVILGLLAGGLGSLLSGALLVRWLGGGPGLALCMLPKAATTPIAMAVAGEIGGRPALTPTLAILGGIVAAVSMRLVFRVLRINDDLALGLAAGTAGSGIAAAQAAELGEGPAAFAAVGIGLNGLVTALLAPWLALLFK